MFRYVSQTVVDRWYWSHFYMKLQVNLDVKYLEFVCVCYLVSVDEIYVYLLFNFLVSMLVFELKGSL